MNTKIFRKQATAAFLNNDTRGTIVQTTPPAMTVLFGTVTVLVVLALGIGIFGRVQIPLEGRGAIRPSERPITLRAQRGGRVASLPKKRGDVVKAGDVVVALDTGSDALALAACRRELEENERDSKALDDRADANKNDLLLTMQRTRAHDRHAVLDTRCTDLARAVAGGSIVAPSDGVVADIGVVAGDSIREGDVVAGVTRPETKLVGSLKLPETRRTDVAVGHRVRLAFDAFPSDKYGMGSGRVVRLDYGTASSDKTKKDDSIVAEVAIDELPKGLERAEDGMTFTGLVDTGKTRLISFLLPGTDK